MTLTRCIEPGPGQESVWDYPRPPRLERMNQRVHIVFNGEIIADTTRAYRVLETSHPPTYYLPPNDLNREYFEPAAGRSLCEWKGQASYYDVAVGDQRTERAAWFYRDPTPAFADIKNYVAVYPSRMEACFVDGERVRAQEGDFYGGWVTSKIVGPFKGGAGTWGW